MSEISENKKLKINKNSESKTDLDDNPEKQFVLNNECEIQYKDKLVEDNVDMDITRDQLTVINNQNIINTDDKNIINTDDQDIINTDDQNIIRLENFDIKEVVTKNNYTIFRGDYNGRSAIFKINLGSSLSEDELVELLKTKHSIIQQNGIYNTGEIVTKHDLAYIFEYSDKESIVDLNTYSYIHKTYEEYLNEIKALEVGDSFENILSDRCIVYTDNDFIILNEAIRNNESIKDRLDHVKNETGDNNGIEVDNINDCKVGAKNDIKDEMCITDAFGNKIENTNNIEYDKIDFKNEMDDNADVFNTKENIIKYENSLKLTLIFKNYRSLFEIENASIIIKAKKIAKQYILDNYKCLDTDKILMYFVIDDAKSQKYTRLYFKFETEYYCRSKTVAFVDVVIKNLSCKSDYYKIAGLRYISGL